MLLQSMFIFIIPGRNFGGAFQKKFLAGKNMQNLTRFRSTSVVQNFGEHTPKKFRERKTCKIWSHFGRFQSSAAKIFEKDEDIQNRIVIPSMAIRPALGKTSTVKFGLVTLEI